jgi:hypothetical protein
MPNKSKRWIRGQFPWVVTWDMDANQWRVAGQFKIMAVKPDGPLFNFDGKGIGWHLQDDLFKTWEEAEAEVRRRQVVTFGRDTRAEAQEKPKPVPQTEKQGGMF